MFPPVFDRGLTEWHPSGAFMFLMRTPTTFLGGFFWDTEILCIFANTIGQPIGIW